MGDQRPEAQPGFDYGVFISYSSRDRTVATRVQRELERFRTPRSLRGLAGRYGPVPPSLGRVFLDRTDLSAAPQITDEIRSALKRSGALLVLCSHSSADPKSWVNREIAAFRMLRPEGRVFALIVADEPPGCFPSELLKAQADASPGEPLAADIRPEGDGFLEAILKLCSGMIGVDFDLLRRRRLEADRRRRAMLIGAGALYAATITGALVWVGKSFLDLRESRRGAIALQAKAASDAGRYDLALLFSAVALAPENSAIEASPEVAAAQATRAIINNRLKRQVFVGGGDRMAVDAERRRAFVAQSGFPVLAVDIDTGAPLAGWSPPKDGAMALALSPDRATLAIGAVAGAVVLVDASSGELVRRLQGGVADVRTIAFSRTGDLLVAGDQDGVARVFDVASGALVSTSPIHKGLVGGAAFSFDGTRILSGSYGASLIEWDARSGASITAHENQATVGQIRTTALGSTWLATFALGKRLVMKNNLPPRPTTVPDRTINLPEAAVDVATSADFRLFATASWAGKSADVVEVSSGRTIATLKHPEWVDFVAFTDDDRTLLTYAHDGVIRHWENPGKTRSTLTRKFGDAGLTAAAWTGEPGRVLAGSRTTFALADAAGKQPIVKLAEAGGEAVNPSRSLNALVVDRATDRALIGWSDGLLVAYDLKTSTGAWALRVGEGEAVKDVALHPDGKRFGVRLAKGAFQMRSLATGELLSSVQVETPSYVDDRPARSIAFDPTGAFVAELPAFAVQIRRLSDNAVLWRAPTIDRTGTSIAWSPDGARLAVGTAGETLRLYTPFRDSPPRVLRGHTSWVTSLSWSSDSRHIAASSNNEAIVWSAVAGENVLRADIGGRFPTSVAFAPGGDAIAIADTSGFVSVAPFVTPSGDLRASVCAALPVGGRTFNATQMQEYDFLRPNEADPCKVPALLSAQWAADVAVEAWMGATSSASALFGSSQTR